MTKDNKTPINDNADSGDFNNPHQTSPTNDSTTEHANRTSAEGDTDRNEVESSNGSIEEPVSRRGEREVREPRNDGRDRTARDEAIEGSTRNEQLPDTPVRATRCRKCGKYACTCSHKHRPGNVLAILLSIIAIACSGTSIYLTLTRNNTQPLSFTSGPDSNSANFTSGSIAEVASRVSPSVVSIVTETRSQNFYGQSATSSAAGTGFIISADGYVLTNKHVIENAENISVVLDNGTAYTDVEQVGTDPLNDAAILKIKNVSDLSYLKLGDSKTITVGQEVIAVGNALGLYQNTVTSGIISGTGRSLVASDSTGSAYEALSDMIQTDAAINQGNSGGPLVNAAGEVIGINTAVSSANNIGFAIPISSVKGIIKSVTETGSFKRAYLGVYYNNLTAETAKAFELDVTTGAYIHNSNGNAVISGSAADKAGLKDGDIIIAVNGTKIGTAGSLSSLLGEYTVGDTVQLTVLRDGNELTVKVTLQEYQEQKKSAQN